MYNMLCVNILASFPVSTANFFWHVGKKEEVVRGDCERGYEHTWSFHFLL